MSCAKATNHWELLSMDGVRRLDVIKGRAVTDAS
jgi:hypothetical protein